MYTRDMPEEPREEEKAIEHQTERTKQWRGVFTFAYNRERILHKEVELNLQALPPWKPYIALTKEK